MGINKPAIQLDKILVTLVKEAGAYMRNEDEIERLSFTEFAKRLKTGEVTGVIIEILRKLIPDKNNSLQWRKREDQDCTKGRMIMQKIIRNAIRCKKCGDIIESKTVHDFKFCSCGSCAVDGGHDYLRRCGNREDWEELSEAEKVEGNDALT